MDEVMASLSRISTVGPRGALGSVVAAKTIEQALHITTQEAAFGLTAKQANYVVTAIDEHDGDENDTGYKIPIGESLSLISARYTNAVLILLAMSHMTVAKSVAEVFSCQLEPSGVYVLTANPELACFQGEWSSFFLPAGLIVGIGWVFALPFIMAILSINAANRVFKSTVGDIEAANTDVSITRDIARFGCTCTR